MAHLTKEQILQSSDLRSKVIKMDEWGGEVTIKELTAIQRDHFEGDTKKRVRQNKPEKIGTRLIALCTVDGNGNRYFTDDELLLLGEKSGTAMEKLATEILKINNLGADAIKTEAKNS